MHVWPHAFVLFLPSVGVQPLAAPALASESVRPVSARVSSATPTPIPAAASVAASQGDPIDRLRERLVERPAGVKVSDTPAALDLRLATNGPTGAAATRFGVTPVFPTSSLRVATSGHVLAERMTAGDARHITMGKVALPANRGLLPLRFWPPGDVAIL